MLKGKPSALGLLAAVESEGSALPSPKSVVSIVKGVFVPTTNEFADFCRNLGVSTKSDPLLVWAHLGVVLYTRHLRQRPPGRPKGIKLTETEKKVISAVERRLATYGERLSASFQKFKETGIYDPSTIPRPVDFNKALRLELRSFSDNDREAARKKLTRYWNARRSPLADLLSKRDGNQSRNRSVAVKSRTEIN